MVSELILFFLFYILVVFETSFLFYFAYPMAAFYPIFIVVFLSTFFNLKKEWLLSVIIGGFFLDVFSGGIFGLKTLSLILAVVFLRFLLSFVREKSLFWFAPVFSAAFLFYEFSFSFFNGLSGNVLNFFVKEPRQIIYPIFDAISQYSPYSPWTSLIYNLILAVFAFFFVKYVFIPLKKIFKGRGSTVKL